MPAYALPPQYPIDAGAEGLPGGGDQIPMAKG